MNELAVKAANGTNTTADRVAIQSEISALTSEISRVAESTQFNTLDLLKGTFDKAIQVGAANVDEQRINIKIAGNDLFNGGINRFTLYSNRMMFRKMEDNDSRCIQLSLRYRFNVTPSKYKGTGAGNAEKNRL